ncbi:hypothetical protein ILYODFUR_018677 [Ilyodon furcidens]|uniref:Uncharacterized protein n=1 Tax=Ilyodon furcidens TaxID=33524 RepID=A0ABV0SMD6_9TELE
MPVVTHFASVKPWLPTSFNATPTALSLLTSTTVLPKDRHLMELHTIVIIVIFCVVCFLLLLAIFYASCFHFSIGSSRKESRSTNGCSVEAEDTTYKHSSFENQSVQNAV